MTVFTLWTHAQKINNNWLFGHHAGLSFNTDPPTPLGYTPITTDSLPPPRFASAISSRFGYLQFYTDGLTVWNSNHEPILPDNWRWPLAGQAMPLVCPYPTNDSLYYIFGISTQGQHPGELLYLTINTQANFGSGAIVYPSSSPTDYFTVLKKNKALLLAGTAHCNQKDTWIVSYDNGAFSAFLVTAGGVQPNAVTSAFAPAIVPPTFDQGWSNLKFSANGERLIMPAINANAIFVFDFNNATGLVSNPRKIRIPAGKTLEDGEISPDGSRLYFGSHEKSDPGLEQHNIYQLDLNAGTPAQIEATLYKMNDRADRSGCTPHDCYNIYRCLQVGPDGKIYVSMRDVVTHEQDLYLSVIEEPNKAAPGAVYKKNAVEVGQKYRFLNYNYIRSGSFSLKENGITVQRKSCRDQPVAFSLLLNKVDSVRWDFGDPASGEMNASRSLTPQHIYSAAGAYNVTAYVYTRCIVDTSRKQVILQDNSAVRVPASVKDTSLCLGDRLQLDVSQPTAMDYVWENNMETPQRLIEDTGLYSIRISNECSFDYKRFHVNFTTCKCVSYVPTAFTPNNDYLNDRFKPSFECPAVNYRFQVVDRWGGVVFHTSQPNEGWDGKIRNNKAPIGVYAWLLQYTDPNTRQTITKKGTVALLR